MKKIVAIVGSLREKSIHRTLLNEYKEFAKEEFEIIEGEIKDIPLYSEDYSEQPNVVKTLADQIEQADGILFFSPEYNYSIPGVLKNAIDWVSRDDRKPFDKKVAAIIGASPGNFGTARMQYHLRQVAVFLNLTVINKPEILINKAYEKIKDGQIVDESTREFLQKHVGAFKAQLP